MPIPTPQRLETIVQAISGQRVLVIGDLMLDRYLWGDTTRISPEAPVDALVPAFAVLGSCYALVSVLFLFAKETGGLSFEAIDRELDRPASVP